MFLLTFAVPLRLYLLQAVGRVYSGDEPFLLQVFYFLLFALIMYFILKLARDVEPTNHWQHHFDQLHLSSMEFYKTLEEEISRKEMPNVKLSQITLSEGGMASANRLYLRIERNHLLFDICAAPFGHGFFISWWLGEKRHFIRRIISSLPFVGGTLERAFFPATYYAIDTEEMFKHSIHTVVLSIIDAIAQEKGIRGLTELERKPVEAKR